MEVDATTRVQSALHATGRQHGMAWGICACRCAGYPLRIGFPSQREQLRALANLEAVRSPKPSPSRSDN